MATNNTDRTIDKQDENCKNAPSRNSRRGRNRKPRTNHNTNNNRKNTVANDASWYAANPELLDNAAKLSFNNPLGSSITISATGDNTGALKGMTYTIPGVMCLDIAPTVGNANNWTDPINIAARNIYTFVRHANSGHSNYDANDLMMYLVASDSVFSMCAFMMRTYGLLRAYSVYNRYYPAAVITSAGLDFDSFLQNMANFRYFINQYVVKASSLCVPANMSYFVRHAWLYSNVYLDAPGAKSQTYVFNPRYFYRYDIGTSTTGPKLVPDLFCSLDHPAAMNYGSLVNYASRLLDSILVNETMNIMSGDILKAYGADKLWHLASMPEDYLCTPVFNAEVLSQIHNATILNVPDDDITKYFAVAQDLTEGESRGALVSNLQITKAGFGSLFPLYDQVVDMHQDNPTPADVMVATRLKVTGSLETGATTVALWNVASEVVVSAKVWFFTGNGADKQLANSAYLSSGDNIAKFHDAPLWYRGSNDALTGIVGELDNYTVINEFTLSKLHGTALLSEFTAPMINTFTK